VFDVDQHIDEGRTRGQAPADGQRPKRDAVIGLATRNEFAALKLSKSSAEPSSGWPWTKAGDRRSAAGVDELLAGAVAQATAAAPLSHRGRAVDGAMQNCVMAAAALSLQ
jgi:hypothetical protein